MSIVLLTDIVDIKKSCRLCLSQDRPSIKIFLENDNAETTISTMGLASKIMACVGIEVEPGENFPDQICNICLDELDRWVKFKELCDHANQKLIYYSTGMPPLPDEVLEKNLQKSNSNNLETSSDFGLGDVSLLEHDSLFNSLDGSRDDNLVNNDLITDKSFSTLFKQNCSSNANNCDKSEEQLNLEPEKVAERENKKRKMREKYSRIYMRKYNCEICLKVFSKFNMLLQHDKIDHRDMTFTEACEKCERLFISKQRLDIHCSMNHREKVFECDICGLKSASQKSLKVHKIRHSGRFICDVCGLAANTNRSLQDHKRTHVDEQERPQCYCDVCKRSFMHQQTLQEHLKTHVTDKREWKCGVCGREFKNRRHFKNHKETHSVEKTVVCDECGAVLKNKTTLYTHKLQHREKKHTCLICDKLFITKNLLTRHMAVHSGPCHVCLVCKKYFSRSDALTEHLKTHQNLTGVCCVHCGKRFTQQRYLKRHIARVHKEDENDRPLVDD